MRITLIALLCLVNAGCAVVRADKEEPVDNGPKQQKAEPELKPSEVLKPKSYDFASPVNDHFYVRGTYFPAAVNTIIQLDPSPTQKGTTLSGEKDLGLDDKVDQGRMEFDIRMRENNHVRIDYFKLDRFSEQPLPRDIVFGDIPPTQTQAGTNWRTKLDWRVLTLTYTYSFVHTERFEGGLGLGIHIIEAHAEGSEPGTLNREKADEAGIFPTVAVSLAYRISKRWSVTARGQQFSASPEDFNGMMSDYHADVQYRWHRNFSLGLGYSMLKTELTVFDPDQPLLFNLDTKGPEIFFRASF